MIWLNMIVKNEATNIERCLKSVKRLISGWVIVDTGSTDATQAVVRALLNNLPGQLYEQPWVNFEFNRNQALAFAKNHCGPDDYILFMDADDTIMPEYAGLPGWDKSVVDCYEIEEHDQNLRFYRPFIVKASLPWAWCGVTHEFLTCAAPNKKEKLTGIYRQRGTKTTAQYAEKLFRDLGLLTNTDDPRTCFYRAQTLKDLGRLQEALELYDKRAGQTFGWEEERWYASYEAAMLKEKLGKEPAEIISTYLQVFEKRPTRAEPLCQLARYCRDRGWHNQAYVFSHAGVVIPFPDSEMLFVDGPIYEWRMLDEFSIALYWTGHFDWCKQVCEDLLGHAPACELDRIKKNIEFAEQQIKAKEPRNV